LDFTRLGNQDGGGGQGTVKAAELCQAVELFGNAPENAERALGRERTELRSEHIERYGGH
jgi:hypothetical protein